MKPMRRLGAWSAICGACCLLVGAAARAGSGPSFVIGAAALRPAPMLIAFGDSRFTEPTNVIATNPMARGALIARLAEEQPDAMLITGDLVWHGDPDDYRAYLAETEAWRTKQLRVFPALGNHEFQRCEEAECLRNWWRAFPGLEGHRWYSAQIGPAIYSIMLDSDASLLAGSEQRIWLEAEVAALPPTVRFALLVLHHPPVTGIESSTKPDYPRQNEIALAEYLRIATAASPRTRFVVIAGHIHNYARFLRDDVTYLITGGGGGTPAELDRGPSDLYRDPSFPNYHYLKLVLTGDRLTGTMWRLADPEMETPVWQVKDRFEVAAKSARRDTR
jgi:3',5'-cyclic AMP phosphodiesterase CpdA